MINLNSTSNQVLWKINVSTPNFINSYTFSNSFTQSKNSKYFVTSSNIYLPFINAGDVTKLWIASVDWVTLLPSTNISFVPDGTMLSLSSSNPDSITFQTSTSFVGIATYVDTLSIGTDTWNAAFQMVWSTPATLSVLH